MKSIVSVYAHISASAGRIVLFEWWWTCNLTKHFFTVHWISLLSKNIGLELYADAKSTQFWRDCQHFQISIFYLKFPRWHCSMFSAVLDTIPGPGIYNSGLFLLFILRGSSLVFKRFENPCDVYNSRYFTVCEHTQPIYYVIFKAYLQTLHAFFNM